MLQLKHTDQAETLLRKAIELDKNLEFAYNDLLSIYVSRKDKKHAVEILLKHYEIVDPNSQTAQLIQRNLEILRNLP